MERLLLCLSFFITFSGWLAHAHEVKSSSKTCATFFDQSKKSAADFYKVNCCAASETMSQFIRDNPQHNLAWSFKQHQNGRLNNYTQGIGWLMGDFHHGNFVFTPDAKTQKMKRLYSDFDDTGRGPLIWDMVRFVITTKSLNPELESAKLTQVMMENYLLGLQGQTRFTPGFVSKLEGTKSYLKHQEEHRAWIDRKVNKHKKFKMKDERLEAISSDELNKSLLTYLTLKFHKNAAVKVLDTVRKVPERGGSKEHERILVLFEVDGILNVFELKELKESTISMFGKQDNYDVRFNKLKSEMFSNDPIDFELFNYGGKTYLIRDKKIEMVSVPYRPKKDKDWLLINDMIAWDFYQAGVLHAKNNIPTYTSEIQNNFDKFVSEIDAISNEYITMMKQAFNEK